MKFPHVNATAEQMWRWFKYPGTDAELELKLLTRSTLAALRKAKDDDAFDRLVAEEYFRDFRGCVDANGTPITNTQQTRELLLKDQDLGGWVFRQLLAVGGWREEGKGDSGTVS